MEYPAAERRRDCNVVLGSNNTALVVENSFWLSAVDSAFFFYPTVYASGKAVAPSDRGQRPSIIFRGGSSWTDPSGHGRKYGVNTVYLVTLSRVVLSGGQLQYQQIKDGDQWPGFIDLKYITSEVSASPLLDLQVAPGLKHFAGLQSINILNYNGADTMEPHYLRRYPDLNPKSVGCTNRTFDCPGLVGITALNCSKAPGCKLSGLTILTASGFEGAGVQSPAVRVFDGDVDSVTVLSSQLTGSADVVDAHNVPRGAWAARSGGGFTIVGTANESAVGNAILTASGGATHRGDYVGRVGITRGHALLLGESGERAARLAIETSGALRWGDGKSHSFDTTLHRVTTNSTTLDLPPIKPGGLATASIHVRGAETADTVQATLTSLGDALIFVSARVAAAGRVLVLFKNEGEETVDLDAGVLRATVSRVR